MQHIFFSFIRETGKINIVYNILSNQLPVQLFRRYPILVILLQAFFAAIYKLIHSITMVILNAL